MTAVACPVCRTRNLLPVDTHPRETFACPDCGEVSSISNLPTDEDTPAVTRGTAWGLALVLMFGVVTGFTGYFVTAKHIAPALKAPAGVQVAAQ